MAKRSAWIVGIATGLIVICAASAGRPHGTGPDEAKKEIEAFNKKFTAAHLRMNNAAIVSMWAEDGISLLPLTAPITGKQRIAKFMDDVVAEMPGYQMFEGYGKMLLVLHKEADGNWRIKREMWNQGMKP